MEKVRGDVPYEDVKPDKVMAPEDDKDHDTIESFPEKDPSPRFDEYKKFPLTCTSATFVFAGAAPLFGNGLRFCTGVKERHPVDGYDTV